MKDKQQKLVEFFYFCLFQQLINVQIVNLKTSVAVLTLGKLFESKQRMAIENKTEDSKKKFESNRIFFELRCMGRLKFPKNVSNFRFSARPCCSDGNLKTCRTQNNATPTHILILKRLQPKNFRRRI